MLSAEKSTIGKPNQFKIYLLWGIASALAVYFSYFIISNADSPNHGFASYYTSAKLLSEGEDVSQFYDNDWFSSKVKNFVPEVYDVYRFNFPTMTLLLLPLSNFSYSSAKIIWTIFNLLTLFFAIGYLIREVNFTKIWLSLILILIFSFQPLYANFLCGQAYVLIFCLLVLAWYAYKNDKNLLLGFVIGLIFIFKSISFIIFIFFLIQKKWKSLLGAVLTSLSIAVLTLPWIGIDAWYAYAENFFNDFTHPSLSVTAYQTIHSFFQHFTIFNHQWNPTPIINLPILGKILSTLSIFIVLVYSSLKAHQSEKSDLAFGAFVVAGLIISPVSIDYHYTIIILPIFILLKQVLKNQSRIVLAALILFTGLIAAYIPYTSLKVTTGWLALFAYPKLYGAVGLWGLLMLYTPKQNVSQTGNNQIR